jgi:hypothetical protein
MLVHMLVRCLRVRDVGAHVSALLTRNDHAVGIGVTLTRAACRKTPFTTTVNNLVGHSVYVRRVAAAFTLFCRQTLGA